MKDETVVIVSGFGFLTIIACVALVKGVDSTILASTAGAIGTTIGYYIKKKRG